MLLSQVSAYSVIVLQLKFPAYTRRTYQVSDPPVSMRHLPSLLGCMRPRALASSSPQCQRGWGKDSDALLPTPLGVSLREYPVSLLHILHPSTVISIPLQ